ncbi:MAG: hypothetical protein ABJA67_05960 [Chthonomonadales bacterium]
MAAKELVVEHQAGDTSGAAGVTYSSDGVSRPSTDAVMEPVTMAYLNSVEQSDAGGSRRRMPDHLLKHLLRVSGNRLYLPAAYRIVWFREECPEWGIETMLIEGGQEAGFATVQCRVYNGEGRVIASGIKTETRQDFPAGWVEKAETGSIARALAVAGFGTQFAPEMDEEHGREAPGASSKFSGSSREARSKRPAVDPNEIWAGPDQCPHCHAPQGKRHGKPCVK